MSKEPMFMYDNENLSYPKWWDSRVLWYKDERK